MTRLKDRIAVVTGASRGIGYFTSLALAREGAHVIALARTVGGLEELDDAIREAGGSATLVPLDITDYDALDRLGASIDERWGKLDIFIANAGMLGPLSPLPHVTADAWELVMRTNLNANWRLIRTLDPLLKLSDAGRAVVVTSNAATGKNAYWGPYAVSKAGVEALALTWAAESANTPLRVNIVDPGAVASHMRSKAFPGENPQTLTQPADIAPMFMELVTPQQTPNGTVLHARDWLAARNGGLASRD